MPAQVGRKLLMQGHGSFGPEADGGDNAAKRS